MKKTGMIIAGILVFSAMIFFSLYVLKPQDDRYITKNFQTQGNAAVDREDSFTGPLPAGPGIGRDFPEKGSLEDRLVDELKKFYGDSISKKSTQAMLVKVMEFLTNLDPQHGESRFYNILKRAFPDLADEIMSIVKKMAAYNRWYEENRQRLAAMTELERKGAIWEKRREIFGDEAEAVWSEEVFAYEERKQTMKETIGLLDDAYDLTTEEKLKIYMDTLNETYGNTPEAYALENKSLLAKVFFGIESVQNELKEMPPDQRQAEINRIRREMGFTEAQVEEHEKIDQYRNRRWETGLLYMQERDALLAESEGEALEEKLKALREKYFKHEAKTIELEEKDGFFRFKRPRVYGRN